MIELAAKVLRLSTFSIGANYLGILLKFQKTKSIRKRQKVQPALNLFDIPLDKFETKLALELGDGDLCLGVRRAVVLASIRAMQTNASVLEYDD